MVDVARSVTPQPIPEPAYPVITEAMARELFDALIRVGHLGTAYAIVGWKPTL